MRKARCWDKWIINLLLLAGSAVVSFAFLESGLRIYHRFEQHQIKVDTTEQERDNEWVFYEYDPILGWKNKAGVEGIFTIPDSKTRVKINSKGLRDREHTYDKQTKFRILVLGDSFTWGFGVEQNERFTEQLQAMLGGETEIVNAGVSGYGTDQELLYFTHEGFKYHPDLVILEFGMEDILNNLSSIQYTYPKPYFILRGNELELMNVPVPKRETDWEERFNIPEVIQSKASQVKESQAEESWWVSLKRFLRTHLVSYSFIVDRVKYLSSKIAPKKIHNDIDALTKALLLEMRGQVNCHGAKFMVVMIPYKQHIINKQRDVFEEWATFYQSNDFQLVDLSRVFLESGAGKSLYLAIDDHWNAQGHQLAAQAIYDFLRKSKLIPIGVNDSGEASGGVGPQRCSDEHK